MLPDSRHAIVIAWGCLLTAAGPGAAAEAPPCPGADWRQETLRDGIRVCTREITGSAVRETWGGVEVSSSIAAITRLIMDLDANGRWVHASGGAEAVAEEDGAVVVRSVVELPLWYSDRDAVTRLVVSQDPCTQAVTIEMQDRSALEPRTDFVRMEVNGRWVLSPQADGDVLVTTQIHADPKVGLPAWLLAARLVDTPFNTLNALRSEITRQEYRDAPPIAGVTEPGPRLCGQPASEAGSAESNQ